MSQQHQPKWKLHKGPSNPSVLVGEKGFVYARNEFIDSEDVEEKTTSFYQNRAIEAYWMQENQRARERGRGRMSGKSENINNNNVTVQSRVEAMRNKTKHKHFQSSLEEVLKDPLPPPPPRRCSSSSEKKMQKEKEEEEEEEEEELEIEDETDEDEEDEDVRKMVDELKRLRSKAAAAAAAAKRTTTSNRGENDDDDDEEEEQPSWKTWYFPPTHEYGSFIPKVNSKKSPLGEVEEIPERVVINNNDNNNNNSVDDDRENALREKKRLEKARLYQKSRNLETHKLW